MNICQECGKPIDSLWQTICDDCIERKKLGW